MPSPDGSDGVFGLVFFHVIIIVEAALEFLLRLTEVARKLWQLRTAEENQDDHQNDEEFLGS